MTGVVGEIYAGLHRYTERSSFSLQPRVLAARYSDDSTLNNDVQTLAAQFDRRWERTRWSASANFARDTTLTSEIGSTGLVQVDRRHEGRSLALGPTFILTERLNAGAQLSASDSHYADARSAGPRNDSLVDYNYRAASIFSSFAYSEQTQLSLTMRAGELHVPDLPLADKQDAALRLGWTYKTFSAWTFDASAGPSYAKSEFSNDTGSVFELGARRTAERWTVNLSLSRDLTPTGQGVLTRSDQLNIGMERYFTEHLRGGISASVIRNQDQLTQSGGAPPGLEYGRVDLTVNWQMTESWSLAFVAGGAAQKYGVSPDHGENFRTSIGIVWNGQQRSL